MSSRPIWRRSEPDGMRERFYNFPVPNRIATSAPTRIDLAGGTIDIWPLYLSHDGASTVNAAINVGCHTIRVPTGVQDYRPALYGGIAAIELRTDAIRRVPIDVDPRELERRIVLAYTGAP